MIGIYFETIKVGAIATENDRPQFLYDEDWIGRSGAFPISLSIPLSAAPVAAEKIIPWLANLLPESHLSEIGQQFGISPQDVIGLLLRIGRDTAGALSIGHARAGHDEYRTVENDAELERIIDELPQKPFLVGDEGVSMSLAGVQDKLPVGVVDGKIAIPLDGTPSTYILKPDAPRLAGSVFNEAFCLTLAKLVGLDAATVTTGRAGKRSYLLVKRYDRIDTPNGVLRVHQEDLCQLLGYFPTAKYEAGATAGLAGPSLARLFTAVSDSISPGARLTLLDAVIFNALICNTDAHAKNYALLIGSAGSAKFAPLYDLVCAQVYPHVTRQLPQTINGKREAVHLFGKDWQYFARSVHLSPAQTLKRVAELAEVVLDRIDAAKEVVCAMPAGDDPVLDKIAFQIRKRTRLIVRQLDQHDPAAT
jgi:serine/threonine-protein kinase HipA